jgi:hypothetical protein
MTGFVVAEWKRQRDSIPGDEVVDVVWRSKTPNVILSGSGI